MSSEVTIGKRIADRLSTLWDRLNVVPNCRVCKGTGEPSTKYRGWAEPVYWKGEIIWVCHNCHGRGKV